MACLELYVDYLSPVRFLEIEEETRESRGGERERDFPVLIGRHCTCSCTSGVVSLCVCVRVCVSICVCVHVHACYVYVGGWAVKGQWRKNT